jgi:DNA-directed RNA polymerase subunit RPC12/RpoP
MPIDLGLNHAFEGGHTYRLIDILAAIQWDWGAIAASLVAIAVICLFFWWRNRRLTQLPQSSSATIDPACPNCGSRASHERGSFERRQCESCGHKFELR